MNLLYGLADLPWWGYVLVALGMTHITIASVTIYLHRAQSHRALDLHPSVSHFFRLWLWLTTGMVTKEWVAVHRKHHAKVETEDDPHSPKVYGIRKVLLEGAELYRDGADDQETLKKYGHGTPDDWLERNVYGRHRFIGVALMAVIDIALFGVYGIILWAVQMAWIPFWAAGIINGAGHYWGYRNFETSDGSTNLGPIGALIGGEEMHNNHHAFPSSAKFSVKPWEFDLGWGYIRILEGLRLARVKKVAPKPVVVEGKDRVDLDTVRAVVGARMHVMSQYARDVVYPVAKEEIRHADASCRRLLKQARRYMARDEQRIGSYGRRTLDYAMERYHSLKTVYEYRRQLQEVWSRTYASHDKLVQALQDWCQQAEASGIRALQDFARSLRGYSLEPAR